MNVATQKEPCAQWSAWIDALAESGFDVNVVTPSGMEMKNPSTKGGDTILLDGMLPNLSGLIMCICARCPEVQIIVATPIDSFTIKYEVLHLNGTIYISGPMASDRFVETVSGFAMQNQRTFTA